MAEEGGIEWPDILVIVLYFVMVLGVALWVSSIYLIESCNIGVLSVKYTSCYFCQICTPSSLCHKLLQISNPPINYVTFKI